MCGSFKNGSKICSLLAFYAFSLKEEKPRMFNYGRRRIYQYNKHDFRIQF